MLDISPVPGKLLYSSYSQIGQKEESAVSEMGNASSSGELRKACKDFESLFLYKLMQTMRRTIPESGLMDGGLTEDIYTDMLDEKIAVMAAESGRGTGLGERLYQDLRRAYGEDVVKTTGVYNTSGGRMQGRKL